MSNPMRDERLMIFGASTRAAAQSAVRAGFRPLCADHFADEDLFELAEVLPISRYPQGLVEAAKNVELADDCRVGQGRLGRRPTVSRDSEVPEDAVQAKAEDQESVGQRPPSASLAHPTGHVPWIYTGALENHPRLLKQLAAIGPLCGNAADVVTRVRDPFRLARVLTSAGLNVVEVRREDQPPPRDGRWLIKPSRSAGGREIRIWDDSAAADLGGRRRERCYFQTRVQGEPHSALYLATAVQTILIGVSRQLVGERQLNAPLFGYCGSLGPIDVSESLRQEISRFGKVIASEFQLRGLFGIDFIFDRHSAAWLTEVNPRYTASVEVFELALGIPLLRDHLLAATSFDNPDRSRQVSEAFLSRIANAERSRRGRMSGKAIVYAPFTLQTPPLAELMRVAAWADWRARIVDRPQPGTIVAARAPLCTLLIDALKLPPAAPGGSLAPFGPPLTALKAELFPHSTS